MICGVETSISEPNEAKILLLETAPTLISTNQQILSLKDLVQSNQHGLLKGRFA